MFRKSILSTVGFLAVTALVMPVFAKPFEKTVTLGQSAKIGATQLVAGDYKIVVDGNNVTIEQGKQVVAQTQGRIEQRDQKNDTTAVVIASNGEIQEIDFGGQNQDLVLSPQP
jgi:hypothetical protein